MSGKAKPVGLGAAELDIEDYPGERPDKLRVEQQMLFRKEWKTLNAVQVPTAYLAQRRRSRSNRMVFIVIETATLIGWS